VIRSRVWILAVAGAMAFAFGGGGPVEVQVNPRRGFARADVRAVITVERDAKNRTLVVVLDGTNLYRRTDETLDGADAARIREVWFKVVPEGRYAVTAIVTRNDGSQRQAQMTLCLSGPNEECE
jgi:hypothetical protein